MNTNNYEIFKEKGTGHLYQKQGEMFVEMLNLKNDIVEYKSSENLFFETPKPEESQLIQIKETEYFNVRTEITKIMTDSKKQ